MIVPLLFLEPYLRLVLVVIHNPYLSFRFSWLLLNAFHLAFLDSLVALYIAGMLVTKACLGQASDSHSQFLSLWAAFVFLSPPFMLIMRLIRTIRLMCCVFQEMVDFLVDIWDQEGLYDWSTDYIYHIDAYMKFVLLKKCNLMYSYEFVGIAEKFQ